MADLDLLDYLSADHRALIDAGPTPRVAEVAQHLSVERDLLYPVISHHLAFGEGVVEDLRDAERRLEQRLRDYENDPAAGHTERLRDAIAEHVESQEHLFSRLRDGIPEAEFLTQSELIALSVGGSPTHAHPHLADGGVIGHLVEDLTSAADHTIDRLHGKKDRESD